MSVEFQKIPVRKETSPMNPLGIVKIRVHITKPNGKMLWPWAIKPDFPLHSIFTISIKIQLKLIQYWPV